jgi:4-diphosphocytidyl-2-C-methyl-D-erythritol kinase
MILERAYAKVNLVLRVGPPRPDGLHPLASLFASLELADDLRVEPAERDEVVCPGVPGDNLARAALDAFRAVARAAELPPLRVEIEKRIPVSAGLGGGSADAAAVLRAANVLTGGPLSEDELRAVGATLGSDVPSQVAPRNALVTGVGERVEPVNLPAMALVLVPQREGLSTAAVYRRLDELGGHATELDAAPLRALAGGDLRSLARGASSDLEPAALSLRPELGAVLERLRAQGALAARVSGSGPTAFGIFADRDRAERAAAGLQHALVTEVRA